MNVSKTNTELIKLLNKSDIVSFDAIYERYSHRLMGFVMKYLKNEEDAEEIVQEVFMKIWESREKIDAYSSFESFLFTIAYNSTITLLRKRVIEQKYLSFLLLRQKISSTPQIIDEIHFNELFNEAKNLISKLSPRQQEVFRLSREEGLTYEAIAQKLQISPNTVKNHIATSLAFLKSEMDNGLIINALFYFLFF